MTAPVLYVIIWLSVFGGSALRAEREAAALHTPQRPFCCLADPALLDWEGAKAVAGGEWLDILLGGVTRDNSGFKFEEVRECTKIAEGMWKKQKDEDVAVSPMNFQTFYSTMDKSVMSVSDDARIVRFSCLSVDEMWFALMNSKGRIGGMLCVVSIIGILLYFVTSLDSGSLVLDIMASNGDQNPPRLQRVFWAAVQGATASALLVAGGTDALSAVQTASMLSGLVYAMMLCFLAISLWRGLAMEVGDLNPYGTDFKIGIIDPFTVWNPKLWGEFTLNIFMTPYIMFKTNQRLEYSSPKPAIVAVTAAILWVSWIALHLLQLAVDGLWAVAWTFYLTFVLLLTIQRGEVRSHFNINGNPVEDFFAAMVLYPSVAVQLHHAFEPKGLTSLVPDHRIKIKGLVPELGDMESKADVVLENGNASSV